MRTVSRFEANLLQILRCLLGRAPLSQTLPLVTRECDRPPCLGRDCVELVQQALSTGIVVMLTRMDGWYREKHLRDDEVVEGRLWERTQPEQLGLDFSINTVDFLMWLTAASPLTSTWSPHKLQSLTLGDQFVLFLAFQALRNTDVGNGWCGRPLFQSHGLCAVMFPDDFATRDVHLKPDFDTWIGGQGAPIFEAAASCIAGMKKVG